MKNNINTKLSDNKFLSEEDKQDLEEEYTINQRALFWKEKDEEPEEHILKPVLESLLIDKLGDKLTTDYKIYISDHKYFRPPEKNSEEIIFLSRVYDRRFFDDKFDCDDFALMMKAHFVEAAYKDNGRRDAICFGIAWGLLSEDDPDEVHALNWMFVKEHDEIIFVEPQTGDRFEPRDNDRDIYFILV